MVTFQLSETIVNLLAIKAKLYPLGQLNIFLPKRNEREINIEYNDFFIYCMINSFYLVAAPPKKVWNNLGLVFINMEAITRLQDLMRT